MTNPTVNFPVCRADNPAVSTAGAICVSVRRADSRKAARLGQGDAWDRTNSATFSSTDLLTERRLSHAQPLRRAGKAELFGHCDEIPQVAQVHARPHISIVWSAASTHIGSMGVDLQHSRS